MVEFTHFDQAGNAIMVDVSNKEVTHRIATSEGCIAMSEECFKAIVNKTHKKGDVLTIARVAGIMATKQNSNLIPLCHPLPICAVSVDFELDEKNYQIKALCRVTTDSKTGVEMEALTGVSITLLTIYDMCKAVDKAMEIRNIHLVNKVGGKSGSFNREEHLRKLVQE